MQLKPGDAHVILNGSTNTLKFFYVNADGSKSLRHQWEAHDVGVGDANPPNGDEYGHLCKIPPADGYTLGVPGPCGPNSDDGAAYGWWATPINDNPEGTLAAHGRSGLMIHGGGSGLADPFAPLQGWEWTLGCIRMQNVDNGMQTAADGTLVNSVRYVQQNGSTVYLEVAWP